MTIQLPPLIMGLPIQLIPIPSSPTSSLVPPPPPPPPPPPISPLQKTPERIALCLRCGRTRIVIDVNNKMTSNLKKSSVGHTELNDSKIGIKKIKEEEGKDC